MDMENDILTLDYEELNEEIKLRAKNELNETFHTRILCLKELKERIQREKNLTANVTDEFLLQFLRVKKFNPDQAFCLLKRYYGHRQCYKSLYKNYTPKQNWKIAKSNIMNFLPWRSPDGCAIWLSRCGMWDPEISDFEEIIRFGLMCHEKALQNPVTQICGLISIVDLKKFSWAHLFHASPTAVKSFISATQDCFPIRHRAIHIVNNPSIFELLFALIKPLLNKKIKNRIHFHGDDLNSLHKHLSPTYLPEELGGHRGKFENQKFYDLLLSSEDEFIQNNEFGFKDN